MIRKFAALVTAGALTFGAVAPAVAMDQELNMLMGAVYFDLKRLGVDTDSIENLTLAQLAEIRAVTSGSSMDESTAKTRVENIISKSN